jgi:hypothetical protein
MPSISQTEQEWKGRAIDLNYRCRVCREHITFPDQQLYFAKGLCAPCLELLDAERNDPNSKTRKRLEEIRSRGGKTTSQSLVFKAENENA